MSVLCLKYRLYPSKSQQTLIAEMLATCCQVYNSMLLWRKVAWETQQKSINRYDQKRALPVWKDRTDEEGNWLHPELRNVNAQVLQQVVDRVDRAYRAFFKRVKQGQKPGFPRFKSEKGYDSLNYVQDTAFSIGEDYVSFSKIGKIKAVIHRQVEGKLKQCVLKREGQDWYACVSMEAENKPLAENRETIAMDMGLEKFAVLSNGQKIDNPRFLRRQEKRLAKAQSKLERQKKDSNRTVKNRKSLSRIHKKVRNQRHNFIHQQVKSLVDRFGIFFLEDLNVKNISRRPAVRQDEATGEFLPNGAAAKSGLNKSILDAGWSLFRRVLTEKAARAGRQVVEINPAYTSQDCYFCGYRAKKKLKDRWHYCPICGASLDRDLNAAINLLLLGLKLLNIALPSPEAFVALGMQCLGASP